MEEEKEVLTERVLNAIKNRNASELREIFETVPNIDIAECLDEVDDAAVFLYIFRTVSSEYTSDFFAELTTDQQELIINAFTDKQLIELLENSFADDIVDVVAAVIQLAVARNQLAVNQLVLLDGRNIGQSGQNALAVKVAQTSFDVVFAVQIDVDLRVFLHLFRQYIHLRCNV